MCGFIGYISFKNSDNIQNYQKKFLYFFEKQKVRGPDFSEKIIVNKKDFQINVGFNRLKIQDISENGNKIFRNEKFILLFNGEILNFEVLKKKYFADDKFISKTDTELLFKFLIKFKEKKINELEGMFAFALIDIESNQLLLCRDYTGIKPLYYLINSDGIFFSSDAWFLYSLSEKKLNFYACKYYFQFGFTPKETSLIQDVNKVLPSNIFSYDYNKRKKIQKPYFNVPINKEKKEVDGKNLSNDLCEVVRKNLICDTKIGVFLSGGIDSVIIAILAKKYNKDIQAYTSYFSPENKYFKFNTDFQYSEKICKEFDIKLNKVEINENDFNQKKNLIHALKKLDEPIANLNFFNSFLQSANAKKDDCKVILTGDGADEIFGGYERYQKCQIAQKFFYLKFLIPKIKRIDDLKINMLPEFFYNNINLNSNQNLFTQDFLNKMKKTNNFEYENINTKKKSEVINNFDLLNWLPEESNFKLDRSSMLNSIEARVPFQDKNLIQKYFEIDMNTKVGLLNLKKPFRKLDFIPKYIKNRKKIGWFSPESIFLRKYLEIFFQETFEKNKIVNQDLFENENISNMYKLHKNGSYFKKELITLLTFQIWYDEVINLI